MKKSDIEAIKQDEELYKALQDIAAEDDNLDLNEFLKADDEEEDEEEEEEKAVKKGMKKGEKKVEIEIGDGDENNEDEDEEKAKKKGKKGGFEKSYQEGFEKATEVFAKIIDEKLNKANEETSDRLDKIEEIVEKIGKQTPGLKARTLFEKSEQGEVGESKDERQVLSISKNRKELMKAIEDVYDTTKDGFMKSRYEESIIAFNAGNGTISQEVAKDLFANHNIRVVR